MHIVYQPAATARPYQVDRQHLVARRPRQLDPEGAQLVVPRDEQRTFDDAIAGMLEILLNDGDAAVQDVAVHPGRARPSIRPPPPAPSPWIVSLHGRAATLVP